MDSKYLTFKIIENKPKTQVYAVYSKLHGDRLAIIKWFPRWRQYTFFPETGTIWNNECLNDISAFLDDLKKERKK